MTTGSLDERMAGEMAPVLREATRAELIKKLAGILTLLVATFPGYDFSETSLAQRDFNWADITASAPSENANSGAS